MSRVYKGIFLVLLFSSSFLIISASTADHSKYKELQVEFTSPEEVTAACLVCHTESSKHIMKTAHWTWDKAEKEPSQDKVRRLGKKNFINNF